MGFDLFNNYLVYILINKRIISLRDIDIQKDLIYSNEYKD